LILIAALLAWPLHASAQLKVMTSGGFTAAYQQLLPEFERTTGIQVSTGSGSSQGSGPQTIAAQLARGVPADVVILSRDGLDELIAAKRIAAGTDVDLARSPLGVGVRAGAARPGLSSVEAFRLALMNARGVAVGSSTSSIYLRIRLFPRLGVPPGNVKVGARATEAARMVAAGEAELVVLPVSEILSAPGIERAGEVPAEIQRVQTFSAAVVAGSKELDAGRRLIAFLASQRASALIRKTGMQPVAGD